MPKKAQNIQRTILELSSKIAENNYLITNVRSQEHIQLLSYHEPNHNQSDHGNNLFTRQQVECCVEKYR